MLTLFVCGVAIILVLALAAFVARQRIGRRFYDMLVRLNETLGAEQDPADLGRRFLAAVVEGTRAEAGLLYSLKDGMAALRLRAAHGLDQQQLAEAAVDRGLRCLLGGGQIGPVGQGSAMLLNRQSGFLGQFAQVIAISLATGGQEVGKAFLLRTTGSFRRDDLKLLDRFAPRAAEALENARLFQQNKNAAEENARLYLNLSKLYRLATVDSLTGLHNRTYMQQRLKEEIKKAWRFRQPLAIILLDLDLFCQINELRGQKTGDETLREMAKFIRKTARDYDIIGRYGGEEFLLILPQTSLDGAKTLAERLRKGSAEYSFPEGLRLTSSLGVAGLSAAGLAFPGGSRRDQEALLSRTLEDLLVQTEQAVAQAKEAGRDRVEVAAAAEERPNGMAH